MIWLNWFVKTTTILNKIVLMHKGSQRSLVFDKLDEVIWPDLFNKP